MSFYYYFENALDLMCCCCPTCNSWWCCQHDLMCSVAFWVHNCSVVIVGLGEKILMVYIHNVLLPGSLLVLWHLRWRCCSALGFVLWYLIRHRVLVTAAAVLPSFPPLRQNCVVEIHRFLEDGTLLYNGQQGICVLLISGKVLSCQKRMISFQKKGYKSKLK